MVDLCMGSFVLVEGSEGGRSMCGMYSTVPGRGICSCEMNRYKSHIFIFKAPIVLHFLAIGSLHKN